MQRWRARFHESANISCSHALRRGQDGQKKAACCNRIQKFPVKRKFPENWSRYAHLAGNLCRFSGRRKRIRRIMPAGCAFAAAKSEAMGEIGQAARYLCSFRRS